MDTSILVRDATPSDVSIIVEYNARMAGETEGKRLDEAVLSRGVRRALDDPSRGRYLIAQIEGEPVGQMLVTREWSDWRDGWFWWIQSVYVVSDFRRRGVYRGLYVHLYEEAKATSDVCGLRLYVERENQTAMKTYESLGMVDAGYRLYETVWPSGDDGRN